MQQDQERIEGKFLNKGWGMGPAFPIQEQGSGLRDFVFWDSWGHWPAGQWFGNFGLSLERVLGHHTQGLATSLGARGAISASAGRGDVGAPLQRATSTSPVMCHLVPGFPPTRVSL